MIVIAVIFSFIISFFIFRYAIKNFDLIDTVSDIGLIIFVLLIPFLNIIFATILVFNQMIDYDKPSELAKKIFFIKDERKNDKGKRYS